MDHDQGKLTCNQSTIHIENLSNECFLEIFEYLNGCDICKAFSSLNYRFEQLLTSSSLLYKIEITYSKDNEALMNNFKQLNFINKHKIFSMKLWGRLDNDYFFSSFIINSSLNYLQSLFVDGIGSNILILLLMHLRFLPRLFSLTIDTWSTAEDSSQIYCLIFAFPVLKLNKLTVKNHDRSITLPIATDPRRSAIEYFIINHSCRFQELFIILSYTPHIRRLKFLMMNMIDESIRKVLPISLSNLSHISIEKCYLDFDYFQIFITKIFSRLKYLRISVQSPDITFLDAGRWERLIVQYLPELENFYLNYAEEINDSHEYPVYPAQLDEFISSFWIKHRWIFGVEVLADKCITYSIRPYRKRWFTDAQNNMIIYFIEPLKSNQLTVVDPDPHYIHEMIMLDIQRILTVVHVYHLEISNKNVVIGTLVELMNMLPDLETLKIHSLSLKSPSKLNARERLICRSIKENNHIQKLYLVKLNDHREFSFLLDLTPHMVSFKLDYLPGTDVKSNVQCIIENIKRVHNTHLRLLCVCIPTADDDLIAKLKQIIDDEKLLVNYVIKRVLDYLYVEWK